ncbi:MAG: hypothetical protein ACRDQD_25030, partial [Nocardioidaceae bacterium]
MPETREDHTTRNRPRPMSQGRRIDADGALPMCGNRRACLDVGPRLNTKRSGSASDWQDHVPHLRDFGPAHA